MIIAIDKWEIIHAYRNLASEGKASPMLCPDCGTLLATRIREEDDDPWLWCFNCPSWKKPGLDFFDRIRPIVEEFYV